MPEETKAVGEKRKRGAKAEVCQTAYTPADLLLVDGKPVPSGKGGTSFRRMRFTSDGPVGWAFGEEPPVVKHPERVSKDGKKTPARETRADLLVPATSMPPSTMFQDAGHYAKWLLNGYVPGLTERLQAIVTEWDALSEAERAARGRKQRAAAKESRQAIVDSTMKSVFLGLATSSGKSDDEASKLADAAVLAYSEWEVARNTGDTEAIARTQAALQAAKMALMM